MYIMNGSKKEIINADFVERFCLVYKPDAVLLVASYNESRCVTVAKYIDDKEAKEALSGLFGAMASGQRYYDMPDSLLFAQERIVQDARTRRKGGS